MPELELDLSGIGIRLSGLTPTLADRLRSDWAGFVSPVPRSHFLRLDVRWIARGSGGEFQPKAMQAEAGPDGARFTMPEGVAEIDASGTARLCLRAEPGDRSYFTLLNLLRACLAWRLPDRGGAMLHAAGLVVAGRAFVLVGGEGTGKSTWARLGEQGGARVLSDDIVVVDGAAANFEALGAPFRSTHRAAYAPGRWPLAAILFPEWGTPPGLRPASALLARARVAANLPFIAEALERDERVAQALERLATELPCLDLRFGLEPSFLALLRKWPDPKPGG